MKNAGINREPHERINMHTFRRSLGTARIYNLLDFDRFCAANYPGRDTPGQDIVLEWAVIRPAETANGFATRISAVRQFGKYLAMIGEDAYIIPDGFRGGDMPLMLVLCQEKVQVKRGLFAKSMEFYETVNLTVYCRKLVCNL